MALETACEPQEAQEDPGGEEGIAPRSVAVVRLDGEQAAQGVEVEAANFPRLGERACPLQVQGQIHGVQRSGS